VKVFWLDRERALENVREGARRLGSAKPQVLSVSLFGSLAEGRAVPGSDADVLVLLSSSGVRFLDRPLEYLPFFSDCGIGVDLFCYTLDEAELVPFAKNALSHALTLWEQEGSARLAEGP
jgi:predicted nucleotidyltransferase